jgi:DNA-binding Xre family transcriptional regulator
MTDSGKELRRIMKTWGMKSKDLASLVGITEASLRNIIYGQSESRRARQKITDLCQVQLWNDIQIGSEPLLFLTGYEIKLPTLAAAAQIAHRLREFAVLRGNTVHFTKPISMMVPRRIAFKKNPTEQTLKASATTT